MSEQLELALQAQRDGYNLFVPEHDGYGRIYKSIPDGLHWGEYWTVKDNVLVSDPEHIDFLHEFDHTKVYNIEELIMFLIKIEHDGWIPLIYGIYPENDCVINCPFHVTTKLGQVRLSSFVKIEESQNTAMSKWSGANCTQDCTVIWSSIDYGEELLNVTAWRPFPKPYKGD